MLVPGTRSNLPRPRSPLLPALLLSVIPVAGLAQSDDPEIAALKQQLSEQKEELTALRSLVEQLAQVQQGTTATLQETTVPAAVDSPSVASVSRPAPQIDWSIGRDSVGDAQAPAVQRGDFPAAFRIMGRGDIPVDLAIAGFVKTVAFWDNNNERDDEYFLPALFGLGSPNQDGQFKSSADLSRVFIDGRTDVGPGRLRAYIEWEFRNDFNLRHAYADWSGAYGALRTGQFWSNFMDLGALPESNIEPLVSGAGFARQTQIKYTSPPLGDLSLAFSVEDPSSNDVVTDSTPLRSQPDFIGTMQWNITRDAHIQFGGLWRNIKLREETFEDTSTNGWGLRTAGAWRLTPNDRILGGLTWGDGIGRYMLGLDPVSGGYVDEDGDLNSREAFGGFASYQHRWDDRLRFNLTAGYAEADDGVDLPGDQFESSTYFGANFFYEISPYLVVSTEYNWGKRDNLDGSDFDDHRITLGLQLY